MFPRTLVQHQRQEGIAREYKPIDQSKMSDNNNSDNRSAAGSVKSNSSGQQNQKKFQKFPSGPAVNIGIDELRGFYYVYGRPDQAQIVGLEH
jgi:hypothetical protein